MRGAALFALLLLLVAGCIEEPKASPVETPAIDVEPPVTLTPTPVEITLPPFVTPTLATPTLVTPAPTPRPVEPPTLEGVALLRASAAQNASATFVLENETERFALRVTSNATWSGAVELRTPDLRLAGECRETGCVLEVEAPAPGVWTIRFPPGAPEDLVAEAYAVVREVAPVPPPAIERTQHLLYERAKDLSDAFYVPHDNDTFAVPLDYDRLVLKVHATQRAGAPGLATTRLVAPDGARHGACDASEERCVLEVARPATGLWRVEYDGKTPARLNVTGYGLDVLEREMPARVAAFAVDHTWPRDEPSNRSQGFYAPEGFGRVELSLSFPRAESAYGVPFVLVRAPNGTVMRTCAATNERCDGDLPAAAGVWRVLFLGPASGAARVTATLDAGAPREPVRSAPELVLLTSYSFSGLTNRTEFLNLYGNTHLKGQLRVDVVPDQEGWTPSVTLWEPGPSGQMLQCTDVCDLDLTVRQDSRWWLMVNGRGNGTASVSLTMHDEPGGAFDRSGNGATFVAYNASHSYSTWADKRGDFADGMHIPGNWTTITISASFPQVGAEDEDANATIEVRDPFGTAKLKCARPARACTVEVPATRGLWEVWYRGVDLSSSGWVTATVR